MINIDNKFDIGQIVYLKTDPEQLPRMCTGIKIGRDSILYQLCCGVLDSMHYDIEITLEADILKTV